MTDREERRTAAIERDAKLGADALNGLVAALQTFIPPLVRIGILDRGLLDDDYEQVGWQSTITGYFYRSDAPNRVPVFRKVSNTGEPK